MSFRREMIEYMAKYRNRPLMEVLDELSFKKKKNEGKYEKAEVNSGKEGINKNGKSVSKGIQSRQESEKCLNIKVFFPLTPPHYVKCPITKCEHCMDPCHVMAHYAIQHKNLIIHRVFDDLGEGFTVNCKPFSLEKYSSHCIALLAFGGKVRGKKGSLPIVGCRRSANEGLPPHLEHLKYDLPILIMASRSIVAIPPDPREDDKRYAKNMVVIWPATIEVESSAKDMYCWILGRAPAFMEKRTTLVEMRSFTQSKDSMYLLLLDSSTFKLSMQDIDRIILWGEVLKIDVKFKLLEFMDFKSEKTVDILDYDAGSNHTFLVE